jgi:ribonuclease HII
MWVVGIDEAGYGPNLGPLVQAAVAVHLPDDDPAGWESLKPLVRRCHEPDDGRLLIDDSKKVYTGGGLEALERSVLVLAPICMDVAELVRKTTSVLGQNELAEEPWFDGKELLPLTTTREGWWAEFTGFGERSQDAPATFMMEALITPTLRFNRVVAECYSKSAILGRGLVELVSRMEQVLRLGQNKTSPFLFLCDKHGGRNYYAAMLQQAFPDGWVVAEVESAAESRYRVELLERPIQITFKPRADAESVAVALASMLAKYLREVCMKQFNRFWAKHVPGIEPTAGYPNDAKRFYAQIQAAMEKLGLKAEQVWRQK